MAQDNIQRMYDHLSKSYNMGSIDKFRSSLETEEGRKRVYDEMSKSYNMGTLDDFTKGLGLAHTAEQNTTAPAAPKAEDINPTDMQTAGQQQVTGDIPVPKALSDMDDDELERERKAAKREYDRSSRKAFVVAGPGMPTASRERLSDAEKANPARARYEEIEREQRRRKDAAAIADIETDDAEMAGMDIMALANREAELQAAKRGNKDVVTTTVFNSMGLPMTQTTPKPFDRQEELDRVDKEIARRNRNAMASTEMKSAVESMQGIRERLDTTGSDNTVTTSTRQLLTMSEKLLDAPSTVNGGKGYWQGVGDGLTNPDTYTMGVSGIARNAELCKVAEKIGNGEEVTQEEMDLIDAYADYLSVQMSRQNDLPAAYLGGVSSAESMAFMAQMMLTGAAGAAIRKGLTKVAVRKFGKEGAEKLTKFIGRQAVKSSAGKVHVYGAEKAAESLGKRFLYALPDEALGVTTQTLLSPTMWRDMEENKLEHILYDKDFTFRDFLYSYGNWLVENATERKIGAGIDAALGGVLGTSLNIWGRKLGANMGRYVQGPLAEMGEEYAGAGMNLLRSVWQTDEDYKRELQNEAKEMFTPKGFEQTAYAIIPQSALFGLVGSVNGAAKMHNYDKTRTALMDLLKKQGATDEQAERIMTQVESSNADGAFMDRLKDLMRASETNYLQQNGSADIERAKAAMAEINKTFTDYFQAAYNYNQVVDDVDKKFQALPDDQKAEIANEYKEYVGNLVWQKETQKAYAAATGQTEEEVSEKIKAGDTQTRHGLDDWQAIANSERQAADEATADPRAYDYAVREAEAIFDEAYLDAASKDRTGYLSGIMAEVDKARQEAEAATDEAARQEAAAKADNLQNMHDLLLNYFAGKAGMAAYDKTLNDRVEAEIREEDAYVQERVGKDGQYTTALIADKTAEPVNGQPAMTDVAVLEDDGNTAVIKYHDGNTEQVSSEELSGHTSIDPTEYMRAVETDIRQQVEEDRQQRINAATDRERKAAVTALKEDDEVRLDIGGQKVTGKIRAVTPDGYQITFDSPITKQDGTTRKVDNLTADELAADLDNDFLNEAFNAYIQSVLDSREQHRQEDVAAQATEEATRSENLTAIDDFAGSIGQTHNVVHIHNAQEAADNGISQEAYSNANAVFRNGRIYIFDEKMTGTKQDALGTITHELVAHQGLRLVLGKDFDTTLDKVWNGLSGKELEDALDYALRSKSVRGELEGINWNTATDEQKAALRDKYRTDQKVQRIAADEYIATLAEKTDLTEEEKTIWDNIVEAVKKALDKILGAKDALTRSDVEDLIRLSYANMRNQARQAAAPTVGDTVVPTTEGEGVVAAEGEGVVATEGEGVVATEGEDAAAPTTTAGAAEELSGFMAEGFEDTQNRVNKARMDDELDAAEAELDKAETLADEVLKENPANAEARYLKTQMEDARKRVAEMRTPEGRLKAIRDEEGENADDSIRNTDKALSDAIKADTKALKAAQAKAEEWKAKYAGLTRRTGDEEIDAATDKTRAEIDAKVKEYTDKAAALEDKIRTREARRKPFADMVAAMDKELAEGTLSKEEEKELMGQEPVNLEDYILSALISGRKFVWSDNKHGTKGLGSHLFGRKSESERRKRFGFLASREKGGLYPEEFAEKIWENLPEGMAEGITDHDIFSQMLDYVMGMTKRQMRERILQLRHDSKDGIGAEERFYQEGQKELYEAAERERLANAEMDYQWTKERALTDEDYTEYLNTFEGPSQAELLDADADAAWLEGQAKEDNTDNNGQQETELQQPVSGDDTGGEGVSPASAGQQAVQGTAQGSDNLVQGQQDGTAGSSEGSQDGQGESRPSVRDDNSTVPASPVGGEAEGSGATEENSTAGSFGPGGVKAWLTERHRKAEENYKRLSSTKAEGSAAGVSIYDFVEKDPKKKREHPLLGGAYHKDGKEIATDVYVLLIKDSKYAPELEGKVTDKKGNIITQEKDGKELSYPNYVLAFPKQDKQGSVSPSELHAAVQMAEVVIQNGNAGDGVTVIVDSSDGKKVPLPYKTAKKLDELFSKVSKAPIIEYYGEDTPLVFIGGDYMGLAMPLHIVHESTKKALAEGRKEDDYAYANKDFAYDADGKKFNAVGEDVEQKPQTEEPSTEAKSEEEQPAKEPEIDTKPEEKSRAEESAADTKAEKEILDSAKGNIEKQQDFGEKIGLARKDVAQRGFTKGETNRDTRPAWMKKYQLSNTSPDADVYDMSKVDWSKPVYVYVEKASISKRHRYLSPIRWTNGQPAVFHSQEEFESVIPVYEALLQKFGVSAKANEQGKYEIYRIASNGKRVVYAEFNTKEEAKVYLASPEGATALLGHKNEKYEIPYLTDVTRNNRPDYRKGRNVSGDDFLKDFGFRGGEFGNWMNAEERQTVMNMAYDALMDLADIIGVSPRALSLDGKLAIAFGARGQGGATAHYEPGKIVINLTKEKGAGSLAHEWAHALDNYFGRFGDMRVDDADNEKWASDAFLTHASYKIRDEVGKAFMEVSAAMLSKKASVQAKEEELQEEIDRLRRGYQKNASWYRTDLEKGRRTRNYNRKTKKYEEVKYELTQEQLEEFDRLCDALLYDPTFSFEWDKNKYRVKGEVADKLHNLTKDILRGNGTHEPLHNLGYYAEKIRGVQKRQEAARRGESETRTVKTNYLKESEFFDRARASHYFSQKIEMFARAFESWVSGKLQETGQSSDYLTYEKGSIYEQNWGHNPYPTGEEAKVIGEALQKLFEVIQEKEENGQTVLYQLSRTPLTKYLDETHREKTEDGRYQLGDKEYMPAVESGDMKKAAQMVRDAFLRAYPDTKVRNVVYHGTNEEFNAFDWTKGRMNMDIAGMFFTPSEREAKDYGKDVKAFYLNIKNPAPASVAYEVFDKHKGKDYAGSITRQELLNMGYDGVDMDGEEYIAFNPEQIKSAEPVTRDDNGNVIPLSERFSESNDIRYQLTPQQAEETLTEVHNAKTYQPDTEDRYQLTKRNSETVDKLLAKNPAINEKGVAAFKTYVEHDDPVAQLAMAKWFGNGSIRLPEDRPLVDEALKVCRKDKTDPMRFATPGDIVKDWQERNSEDEDREYLSPDNYPEVLTNKKDYGNGIVVYDVQDSKEGQQAVRDLMNDHLKTADRPYYNCWCLEYASDSTGKLTSNAWMMWNHYRACQKRAAFYNGRIVAFCASDHNTSAEWWDLSDRSHGERIPVEMAIPGDRLGRSALSVFDPESGEVTPIGNLFKGNKKNGLYREWDKGGTLVLSQHYKGGKLDGLEERWGADGVLMRRTSYRNGAFDGLHEVWFGQGRPLLRENYKQGKLDGPKEEWYSNGQLQERINYKDGKREGISEAWYDNGQLKSRGDYIADYCVRGLLETWLPNGQLIERSNYNERGEEQGIQEAWLGDGKRRFIMEYTEDGKKYIFWDWDGSISDISEGLTPEEQAALIAKADAYDAEIDAREAAETGEYERYQLVTDKAKIDELEAGKTIKLYRAAQLIDGKIYPPMSAKVNGKLREPIELGKWEQAEEHPEMATDDGYFKLDKGNGRTIEARYNPYFHASPSPLNDQFSSASTRPNLIILEVEVPESELTSEYHADKAKDTAGMKNWHSGPVSGKLPDGKKRTVMLSRWDKPVRIVPDSEVAEKIADLLKGENLAVPRNVVTPSLAKELESRGVRIAEEGEEVRYQLSKETDAEYMAAVEAGDMEAAQGMVDEAFKAAYPEAQLVDEEGNPIRVYHGTKFDFNTFKGGNNKIHYSDRLNFFAFDKKFADRWAVRDDERRTPDEVLKRLEEARKKRNAYHGQVYKALKEKYGEDYLNRENLDGKTWNDVFKELKDWEKENLDLDGMDYMQARAELGRRTLGCYITAKNIFNPVEEYDSVGKKMLIDLGVLEADIDSRKEYNYAAHGSYLYYERPNVIQALKEKGYDAMMISEDGDGKLSTLAVWDPNQIKSADPVTFDDNGNVIPLSERFNSGTNDIRYQLSAPSNVASQYYEEMTKGRAFAAMEAHQDAMRSLLMLQRGIAKEMGRSIEDFENAYIAENEMSSANYAQGEHFLNAYYNPIVDTLKDIMKAYGYSRQQIYDYMMAKHGIERNALMSRKAIETAMDGLSGLDAASDTFKADFRHALSNVFSKLTDQGILPKGRKVDAFKASIDLDEMQADFADDAQAAIKKLSEIVYNMRQDKDYSGLTQLTGEKKDFTAAAQHIIDSFEDKVSKEDTDKLWQRTNAATKKTLAILRDGGLMSGETYDSIRSMYDYYIPLRGWSDTVGHDVWEYVQADAGRFGSVMKTAKGRTSKADDPIATIAWMGQRSIMQANRNLMKQRFLNLAQNAQNSLLTVSQTWIVPTTDDAGNTVWQVAVAPIPEEATPAQVQAVINLFEKDMKDREANGEAKRVSGHLKTPYRTLPKEAEQHAVIVKEAGRSYTIYVNGNPRAAQAINGLLTDTSEGFWQKVDEINRFMASNFTQRNPAFILSNLSRDVIFSRFNVAVKEDKVYSRRFKANQLFLLKAMPGLVQRHRKGKLDLSDPLDSMYNDFVMNGGETGYTNLLDIEQFKAKLDRLEKGKTISLMEAWDWINTPVEILNKASENLSRFAAFMASRQMSRSISRSAWDAKQVSVDFNKKGTGKGWGAGAGRHLLLFYNAAVQSLYQFGKLAKEHKGRFYPRIFALVAGGALMPLLARLLADWGYGGEPDDYDNLPESTRRNNICIPLPGGKFLLVPLPIELRAFYGMGELMTQWMRGEMKYDNVGLAMVAQMSELLPLDIAAYFNSRTGNLGLDLGATVGPDVLRPFFQKWRNADYFGLPIYRKNAFNENMPAYTKAYKGTNRFYVSLSEALNDMMGGDKYTDKTGNFNNPALWEFTLNAYFGGTYKTAMQFTHLIGGGIRAIKDEDPDLAWRTAPVLNRFVADAKDSRVYGRKINSEFYRYKDELEKFSTRLNGYRKEVKYGNALEYQKKMVDAIRDPDYMAYQMMLFFEKRLKVIEQQHKLGIYDDRKASDKALEVRVEAVEWFENHYSKEE